MSETARAKEIDAVEVRGKTPAVSANMTDAFDCDFFRR
jgi:hypothetical protein